MNRKKNFLEGLIVFAVMTGILLPVRLLFVSYVSDNWFGSFGVISSISIAMIILMRKGKLGKFGEMFENQIEKFQRGKRGKAAYGFSIFLLFILGFTIFAIEQGNSQHVEIKDTILNEFEEVSEPEKLLEQSQQLEAQDWVFGTMALFLSIFFAFPQFAAIFAVLNETLDGWILHFYTVSFVEYLELFGILIFHRFFGAKKRVKI